MLTPLRRIWLGALALLLCGAVAVTVYMIWGDYSLSEAVWMVVITISTVGYAERTQERPPLQMFTVGLILFGVTAAAYTFGAFMQLAIEGELYRLLGHRRMARDIDKLSEHVVACGFGNTGELLAKALCEEDVPFVIVDQNEDRIEEAQRQGYLVLLGDATNESVLTEAGICRAKTLVTNLPTDAENVFITLTARNLCPSVDIIARAEQPSTVSKLQQAGANRVVQPDVSGARLMARMVTRPTTADLIELVAESSFHDMELDEILIREGAGIVGVNVRETEAHRKHRLLVVAIKRADNTMIFNPDGDYEFAVGETMILMGRDADIDRFRTQFCV
ncbi:MAG: potassium channel protein [Planctomycetales bacterium]|nr:potassium channel protein [Planctomycetales bacterium]